MIATVLGLGMLIGLLFSVFSDLSRRLPSAVRIRLSPRGVNAALRAEERRTTRQLTTRAISPADYRRRMGELAAAGHRLARPSADPNRHRAG